MPSRESRRPVRCRRYAACDLTGRRTVAPRESCREGARADLAGSQSLLASSSHRGSPARGAGRLLSSSGDVAADHRLGDVALVPVGRGRRRSARSQSPMNSAPIRASAIRVSVGLTMLGRLVLCSKPERGAALCFRVKGAAAACAAGHRLRARRGGGVSPRDAWSRSLRRSGKGSGESFRIGSEKRR
jgi:hypothetical protein